MREDDFKALEARWHELYSSYEAIKAALPPVVRREWTNRKRYHPEPHYFLRQPQRGRVVKDAPPHDRQRYEYGFDAQNRVVIERDHRGYEMYYRYISDKIELLSFVKQQNRLLLANIVQCVISSGRIERLTELGISYWQIDPARAYPVPYQGKGVENADAAEIWAQLMAQEYALRWHHEEYLYQGHRISQISSHWNSSPPVISNCTDRFEYDNQKQLQRIVRTHSHEESQYVVVYRRRKRGETLASITANAKQKLVQVIPVMLAAAHLEEPLYCLNLCYWFDHGCFPPEFLPGFERDRQRKLKEHEPSHVHVSLWWYLSDTDDDEPEHVPHEPLVITDPDTLEACERLQVEVYMRDNSDLAVQTLYEICRELNQLDWSKVTAVTPDFIVHACDNAENVEITDSLRLSGASQAQITRWHNQGIVREPYPDKPWLIKPRDTDT